MPEKRAVRSAGSRVLYCAGGVLLLPTAAQQDGAQAGGCQEAQAARSHPLGWAVA